MKGPRNLQIHGIRSSPDLALAFPAAFKLSSSWGRGLGYWDRLPLSSCTLCPSLKSPAPPFSPILPGSAWVQPLTLRGADASWSLLPGFLTPIWRPSLPDTATKTVFASQRPGYAPPHPLSPLGTHWASQEQSCFPAPSHHPIPHWLCNNRKAVTSLSLVACNFHRLELSAGRGQEIRQETVKQKQLL